jgi:hypothetical protein
MRGFSCETLARWFDLMDIVQEIASFEPFQDGQALMPIGGCGRRPSVLNNIASGRRRGLKAQPQRFDL